MNYTNKHLYEFHQELNSIQEQSVIALLMRSRINEFYKQNGVRINSLLGKMNNLQKEYFVIENNQIKHATKDTIPAVYKTVTSTIVVKEATMLRKKETREESKEELVTPEQTFKPEPVMMPGKGLIEYQKKFIELMAEPVNIIC